MTNTVEHEQLCFFFNLLMIDSVLVLGIQVYFHTWRQPAHQHTSYVSFRSEMSIQPLLLMSSSPHNILAEHQWVWKFQLCFELLIIKLANQISWNPQLSSLGHKNLVLQTGLSVIEDLLDSLRNANSRMQLFSAQVLSWEQCQAKPSPKLSRGRHMGPDQCTHTLAEA